MGFFDWIGDTAGKIWSGVKDVAGTVYNGAKSAVNWVADKVQPVIKGIGSVASYIPVVGAGISGLANQISSGIDLAKRGLDVVGGIGSQIGQQGDKLFSRGKG